MEEFIKKHYLFLLFLVIILFQIVLEFTTKKDALEFKRVIANSLSEKEKLVVCHFIQGNIEESFNYETVIDGIVEVYSGKPQSYCSFSNSKIEIGDIINKDLNDCHTITKAQISRGAVASSTEYNPRYSVYKNGMIYWHCGKGSEPNRVEFRSKRFYVESYRYVDDKSILLIEFDRRLVYFQKGIIFKAVYSDKVFNTYNKSLVDIESYSGFNFTPTLLPIIP